MPYGCWPRDALKDKTKAKSMVIWSPVMKTREEIVGGCQEDESYVVTLEILGSMAYEVDFHRHPEPNCRRHLPHSHY